jgi:hypothetical protein
MPDVARGWNATTGKRKIPSSSGRDSCLKQHKLHKRSAAWPCLLHIVVHQIVEAHVGGPVVGVVLGPAANNCADLAKGPALLLGPTRQSMPSMQLVLPSGAYSSANEWQLGLSFVMHTLSRGAGSPRGCHALHAVAAGQHKKLKRQPAVRTAAKVHPPCTHRMQPSSNSRRFRSMLVYIVGEKFKPG